MPLALLLWDYARDNLTADPIRDITLRTGKSALIMLMLSLACTPASTILGIEGIKKLRRPLGLYAFFYASLHLLNIVGVDYWFNFDLLAKDIAVKRYALLGIAAYACLLPLAVTSTKGWRRRLGDWWRPLHWLVYPALLLAVAHYFLQVKAGLPRPLNYEILAIVLLTLRLPGVRTAAGKPQRWLKRRLANRTA